MKDPSKKRNIYFKLSYNYAKHAVYLLKETVAVISTFRVTVMIRFSAVQIKCRECSFFFIKYVKSYCSSFLHCFHLTHNCYMQIGRSKLLTWQVRFRGSFSYLTFH